MDQRKGTVKEISESELRQRLDTTSGTPSPRRDARVAANLAVEVPLTNWDQLQRIYTKNISKGGMLFTVSAPSSLPAVLQLFLTLPDGQRLGFDCDVRHVRQIPGSKEFDVGVQFQSVDKVMLSKLELALKQLGKA